MSKEKLSPIVPAPLDARIETLKSLVPEAFSEGVLIPEQLQEAIGGGGTPANERFAFTWAGKGDGIHALQTPSGATLVPLGDAPVAFGLTKNAVIEGDNLEVLKLLYKPYFGRVKMIYIDPPYNTGGDFIYPDDYGEGLDTYLRFTGQKDTDGNLLTTNPETSGRYHSKWLSMMYPRLSIARQLLTDDGVIFVSIDDREVHHLRMLLNEIFGDENFIGIFTWQSKKGGGNDKRGVVNDQEYVLCYVRSEANGSLRRSETAAEELDRADSKGPYRRGRELNKWGSGSRREDRPTMWFSIRGPKDEEVYPIRNDGTEGRWRWGRPKMDAIVARGDAEFEARPDGTYIVYEKIRGSDPRYKPYRTWLSDVGTTADGTKEVKAIFDGKRVFDFPKPVALIRHLLEIGTDGEGDLVLDFFAGSGTTAQAVLEANEEDGGNRNFILVQLPEPTPLDSPARQAGFSSVAELCRERVARVIATILSERKQKLGASTTPLGFRAFSLRGSHYKQWESAPTSSTQTLLTRLEDAIDPLAEGWIAENLIFEIALKEGLALDSIQKRDERVKSSTIFSVADDRGNHLYVCLDDKIRLESVEILELSRDDIFVCRDVALNDKAAANLALACKLKTL